MTTTTITLTSGERVEAEHVDGCRYRLPGGRIVQTWTEDGEILQDPEATEDEEPVDVDIIIIAEPSEVDEEALAMFAAEAVRRGFSQTDADCAEIIPPAELGTWRAQNSARVEVATPADAAALRPELLPFHVLRWEDVL